MHLVKGYNESKSAHRLQVHFGLGSFSYLWIAQSDIFGPSNFIFLGRPLFHLELACHIRIAVNFGSNDHPFYG